MRGMRMMAERGQIWVRNAHESWTTRTVTRTDTGDLAPSTNEGSVCSGSDSSSPSFVEEDADASSPSSRAQSRASGVTTSDDPNTVSDVTLMSDEEDTLMNATPCATINDGCTCSNGSAA